MLSRNFKQYLLLAFALCIGIQCGFIFSSLWYSPRQRSLVSPFRNESEQITATSTHVSQQPTASKSSVHPWCDVVAPQCPYNQRIEKLVWRGTCTGPTRGYQKALYPFYLRSRVTILTARHLDLLDAGLVVDCFNDKQLLKQVPFTGRTVSIHLSKCRKSLVVKTTPKKHSQLPNKERNLWNAMFLIEGLKRAIGGYFSRD